MKSYALSRSSWVYRFVFGRYNWRMDGFPEPQSDKISLGLFGGLFLFMLIMRPIAFFMMTIFEVMLLLISFLIDGSYTRGRFPIELEIVKVEPWPKAYGRRLPPWIIVAVGIVGYQYAYVGMMEALESLIFFGFIALVFFFIKSGDKSPAMKLSEAVEPVVDKKLRLAYYREPKHFPTLHLVK